MEEARSVNYRLPFQLFYTDIYIQCKDDVKKDINNIFNPTCLLKIKGKGRELISPILNLMKKKTKESKIFISSLIDICDSYKKDDDE